MTTSTMEKIKVMLAFDEGKKLEYQYLAGDPPHIWKPHPPGNPSWNWADFNWRVAPQPPRKFVRWFLESEYGDMVIYNSRDAALAVQQQFPKWTLTSFEMTEIPQNAS